MCTPCPVDAPQSQSCNELIEKGEAALLSSPVTLVRVYGGMMPEQAVQQAFQRQTGEYPNRRHGAHGRTFAGASSRPNSAALRRQKRRKSNTDSRPRPQNRCRTA